MCSRELLHVYAQVARGQVPAGPWLAALRTHLATGTCHRCARALREYERELRRRPRRSSDDPTLWQAVHLGLVDPRHCLPRAFTDAEAFTAELREVPFGKRWTALLRSHRRMRNPVLIDSFVDESRRHLGGNLIEADAWLKLAGEVTARLCGHGFPLHLLAGGSLRIDAHRANLLRVAGGLTAAAARFEALATDGRRRETSRPGDNAEVASLEASLRMDLRQFPEAAALLADAERTCRHLGDSTGTAKILIQMGKCAFLQCAPEEALRYYDAAADLLAPDLEPHLYLLVQHNRADSLIDLGRADEAAAILNANRHRYAGYNQQDFPTALAWLEARIYRLRGGLAEAEASFLVARDRYLKRGLAFDAALVSLDLAELYLEWGRHQQVPPLAAMVIPIFQSQQVHHEALATWLLFQRATTAERLTAARLAGLRRYFHLARRDPAYHFDEADTLIGGQAFSSGPSSGRPVKAPRRRPRGG
jgi:tetratricopeptide (TPR) repeat protein